MALQLTDDVRLDVRLEQFPNRQIHVHAQVRAARLLVPVTQRPRRLGQHEAPDRHDQADFLATGMNSAGNTSPLGVRQRTSASKPAMLPSASCTMGWKSTLN